MKIVLKPLIICCILLAVANELWAQADPLKDARILVEQKEYDKAIDIYRKLYERAPLGQDIYDEYLAALIAGKEYKEAENTVESQMKIKPQDPMLYIDLGKAFLAAGKEKKADEPFEKAIAMMTGDDIVTTKMANTFSSLKQDKYAIKTYEHAIEILHNQFFYGIPLAKLYAKTGDIEKAVNAMLAVGPMQMPGAEDTKSTMLELLGNDPKKLQVAQKALIKRINEQPENTWFVDILTWLYTQKDDWDGALMQIQALDERNRENGERLLDFARTAKKAEQYDIAIKAIDAVTEKGKDQPMYTIAQAERLNALMQQLQNKPDYKPEDLTTLEKRYEEFFTEFPQYYNTEILRDYAMLEAQYIHNLPKAIELLETAVQKPGARREFNGWAKIQLGDYLIISGKIWDASLLYSQVDKEFREDMLGEEARFRNAKLAYYQGDFEWAQGQLSVLKASTSELIANDALYLSVLITENIPPDSNMVPLKRFAYADLLLFQNKDKEAEDLLDSISHAFPKHPLNDDILMLRSRIAVKHKDYNKALSYLKEVFDGCKNCGKDDLLKDDALFKTAELYEKYLKNPAEAKNFYEQLIMEFPGSTYVQTSRVKLSELQNQPGLLP